MADNDKRIVTENDEGRITLNNVFELAGNKNGEESEKEEEDDEDSE